MSAPDTKLDPATLDACITRLSHAAMAMDSVGQKQSASIYRHSAELVRSLQEKPRYACGRCGKPFDERGDLEKHAYSNACEVQPAPTPIDAGAAVGGVEDEALALELLRGSSDEQPRQFYNTLNRNYWLSVAHRARELLHPDHKLQVDIKRRLIEQRDEATRECQRLIDIAGEALGTDPALRNAGCVEALAKWCGQVREERDALRAELDSVYNSFHVIRVAANRALERVVRSMPASAPSADKERP